MKNRPYSILKPRQQCYSPASLSNYILCTLLPCYSLFTFTYFSCVSYSFLLVTPLILPHSQQFSRSFASCNSHVIFVWYDSWGRCIHALAGWWTPPRLVSSLQYSYSCMRALILRHGRTIEMHDTRTLRKHKCLLGWASKADTCMWCTTTLRIPRYLPTRFPLFDWSKGSSVWGTLPLPSTALPTAIIWRSVCRPL
jgi:hypothetical protein